MGIRMIPGIASRPETQVCLSLECKVIEESVSRRCHVHLLLIRSPNCLLV